MKYFISFLLLQISLIAPLTGITQQISLDAGYIKQVNHHMPGINASAFYYFDEHFAGGIEVNRFFSKLDAHSKYSAWDVEMNFHYLLPVIKNLSIYPIVGIGHTSEKEIIEETHETTYERFYSANTGAGILIRSGKWLPHIEYTFSWGHINQQFFLAGISYELEFKHH